MLDLVPVWTAIIAFSVFMYVLLDGFDLGVGMLFSFAPDERARDVMMAAVAPIWDGNETWLVMGGIGLFAAFPLAFAIILPAMYFPLAAMLLGLVFRGVAFEFRATAPERARLWGGAFFAGSLVATFAQGCVLGRFLLGFEIAGREYAGGAFEWLHPFARIAARWFGWPNTALLAPIPIATAAAAYALWRALERGRDLTPFLCAVALFALCYLGLAISIFPYVVPPSITLRQAASAPATQAFLLVGTLVLLPVILTYTGWAYWVFRGKVRPDAGYH